MNLTDRKIDQLTTEGRKVRFVFDSSRGAPTGFGVRITERKDGSSGRSYVLQYTHEGRQYREALCPCDEMTVAKARAKAEELRAERRLNGRVHKVSLEEVKLKDIIDPYLHVMSGRKSIKAIEGYFKRDLLPVLGESKIKEIRRAEIIDLISAKANQGKPVAARCLLAYTKGLFDWCVDREYLDFSPAQSVKAKNIKAKHLIKPRKRTRTLSDEEIRVFWSATDLSMAPLIKLALKLVLITGQRPGEVASMHETEITSRAWTIPASRRLKTNTESVVPLTNLALNIIDDARAEVKRLCRSRGCSPSGYIFEVRKGKPVDVGGLSQAVKRDVVALENNDNKDSGYWKPHDLRRTCRTGLSACYVPRDIAERVIGHVLDEMAETYDQHHFAVEKREALEAWERRLSAILDGTSTDAVAPFKLGGVR